MPVRRREREGDCNGWSGRRRRKLVDRESERKRRKGKRGRAAMPGRGLAAAALFKIFRVFPLCLGFFDV